MANKSLFKSLFGLRVPPADSVNEAGGRAYAFTPEHALAQYALTGCVNGTFYATAEEQLETVLRLARTVSPAFIAKVAIHAREKGAMKDMPALLCAVLAVRDGEMLERVFPRVIDSMKMLRTFMQIVRSGAVGRKSFGTRPRRLIRRWLDARTDADLFAASVGNDPSLADVLRMVHPRPSSASRNALYGYILDRPHDPSALPPIVQEYEAFKSRLARTA